MKCYILESAVIPFPLLDEEEQDKNQCFKYAQLSYLHILHSHTSSVLYLLSLDHMLLHLINQ